MRQELLERYQEYLTKKAMVRELGKLISKYVSHVQFTEYKYFEAVHEEWVVIHFVGGAQCAICETATSVAAIAKDILDNVMHADYGHLETYKKMNEKYVDVLEGVGDGEEAPDAVMECIKAINKGVIAKRHEEECEEKEDVNYDSCGD